MITVRNLSKSYHTRHERVDALKNITLTIPDKSFVMILGESGSGKSTLCSILGLLDTATSGEFHLNGTAIHTLSAAGRARVRRESVGFVFQQYNLIPTLTAFENVELPLGYRHIPGPERRERVLAALDAVGLSHRRDHFPAEMSGGEQQRAAIARALATSPSLLIADEPTGNLDEKTAGEIMTLLTETCREKTVVMVTHNRELVRYGTMVIELKRGELCPG